MLQTAEHKKEMDEECPQYVENGLFATPQEIHFVPIETSFLRNSKLDKGVKAESRHQMDRDLELCENGTTTYI